MTSIVQKTDYVVAKRASSFKMTVLVTVVALDNFLIPQLLHSIYTISC